MVGIAGFEPAVSRSQAERLTKLAHIPITISSMISVTHLSPRGGSYYERPTAAGLEPAYNGVKVHCVNQLHHAAIWSIIRDLNSYQMLGRHLCYHYTNDTYS